MESAVIKDPTGGNLQGQSHAFEPKLYSAPDIRTERCPIGAFLNKRNEQPEVMFKPESQFNLAISYN